MDAITLARSRVNTKARAEHFGRIRVQQPDGRAVYLYGDYAPAPSGYEAPPLVDGVYQRRWNPLRDEWVLVAAGRQGRTYLPEPTACPLCPSRAGHHSEIPATQFEVAVFENRSPAMRGDGSCEVVVYSDQHDASLSTLSPAALRQVIAAWTDRYQDLGSRPQVRYVFIFENR